MSEEPSFVCSLKENKRFWRKCIFVNCRKTSQEEPNIHFFRLPHNYEIAKQWILNSGNLELLHVLERTRNHQQLLYFVCWNHFKDDIIVEGSTLLLRTDVCPKPYEVDANLPSTSNHSVTCGNNETPTESLFESNVSDPEPYIVIDPYPDGLDNEEKSEIVQELIVLKDEETSIDIDEMQIEDVKLENTDTTERNSEHNYTKPYLSPVVTKFTRRLSNVDHRDNSSKNQNLVHKQRNRKIQQICKRKGNIPNKSRYQVTRKKGRSSHPVATSYLSKIKFQSDASRTISTMQTLPRRNEQWEQAEIEFALGLFYKSPTTYRYLQNQQVILPKIGTIRSWLENSATFNPGFNRRLLAQIKYKVSTMEDEDKSCTLIFANINVEGNSEYSQDGITLEKLKEYSLTNAEWVKGSQAMIFVLRGLYSSWSLPLAYFIGVREANYLSHYLVQAVHRALSTGLRVCGVFGDLDYVSKYPSVLAELGVTPEKPYFLAENVKIFGLFNLFSIFDMIKYRWTLNDLIFCDNRASLQDVLYAFRNSTELKGKQTSEYPPVFCKTTVSLIKQAGKNGQEMAKGTADLIKCLSNLYELLNRKEFELSGFLFIIDKTLNKLKRGVYECDKTSNHERQEIFKHLETLLKAIVTFCEEYKPKRYPNLIMKCPVNAFIYNVFSFGDKKPTVDSFRNQFQIGFVDNIMRPVSTDV